ncbi:urease accessory protein D isoform X2 [Nematostella vectensis]|uniref:urease accessory protein D isoform X2 n=1 Tax=Nematostella vectensis TaxID=45351 RepID=UPI0020778FDC|nr:urease accessory protein D isoform X2 [Nematostella vectensis]
MSMSVLPSKSSVVEQEMFLLRNPHFVLGVILKLLVPKYASENPRCKWLYLIAYGGGLVEGDSITLHVEVEKNASVVLTSQASTKVYHSERGRTTSQKISAMVADGALLAVLPSYLVCFKDALYKQDQVFHLAPQGNIILLDWMTAGRMACDEAWQMTSCSLQNEVYIDGKLVFGDSMTLAQHSDNLLQYKMGKVKVVGTCVIIGPYFKDKICSIQEKVKSFHYKYKYNNVITISASPLAPLCDGIVIKLMSTEEAEMVQQCFSDIIADVVPNIGGDPLIKQ